MNICELINCPYFEPTSRGSYGCHRYTRSSFCHLKNSYPSLGDNEYILCGEASQPEIELLAKANDAYLLADMKYQSDLLHQQERPNRDVKYPTRSIPRI
jgi:hypothetical protein